MTSHFFVALLVFLALPVMLSKALRLDRIFPLVFLQLLFGLCIHMSGLDAWLKGRDVDLLDGPLGNSLSGLGWLGVSLLVALTGSEAAPGKSDRRAWRFIPISVIGFLSTCALGSVIGFYLGHYAPELVGGKGGGWTFPLAVGLSLSVTALPVLVSILRETGLVNTEIGNMATNCALLDDLWMWFGLAIVLSLATGGAHPLQMLGALAAYLVVMVVPVRAALARWLQARPAMSAADRMLMAVSVIFLSAVATDLIGLHSIFGAFVGGAVLPRRVFEGWRESLSENIQVLLLPFFFIFTGMRLEIRFDDPDFWTLTAIVTLAAVAGKLVSVAVAARCNGFKWSHSFALGSLMQCKGLMELVAINILLEAGVIGAQMFSALAMMALISTCITAPAMQLVLREEKWRIQPKDVPAAPEPVGELGLRST